jgi:tetratricopeptide (TPR) repeat protein
VLAALARAKIEADDFAAASADIDDIGSGVLRAECRLALAQRLSTTGGAAGWAAGPGAIVGLLHAARADALADADMVQCAQVLRAIALAHSELFTGAVDEARQTMVAAAEALNRAPRFRFVPTPWCDTAVAFAELGFWDLAMKIAGGLVTHNAFDGCSALRDLAGVATRAGNKAQARELLARALASAPQVPIPPQRDDLLISLAAEYARLGDLQEARQPALVASNPADAEVQIAIALLESGQVAGALALIDRLPPGAPDSALARLVRALLAAGEVGRGRRVAEGLTDLAQRAERLAAVARQLITLGGADEARQLIATVSELELPFHSPHAAAQFQETVVTVLAEAGDLAAASRFVEQRWRTARHRSDLLLLMPLAGPLVRQQPELAGAIQASVGWVEQTLLAA